MSARAPVVFVMIDGLRPDAIDAAGCTTLQALRGLSAWTYTAQSIRPSVTLPCHMSIFHSVPPARHGVTTNEFQPMARPLPGLFEVAKAHEKQCASIYGWEPLRNLSRPETLEFAWYRNLTYVPHGDDLIADVAIDYIATETPDFAFVYFGTVDTAGHYYGWMSEGYLAQAARVDRQLQRLLTALPTDAHVLLQADHGGHERNHGTDLPDDMLIPWMMLGPTIRPGHALTGPVSLLDTAPTLARMLKIPPYKEWEGRVVSEGFLAAE